MSGDWRSFWGDVSCWVTAAFFAVGILVLGVRLKAVQVDGVGESNYDMRRQSLRRVQTEGGRGRILACDGTVLAGNRPTLSITINPSLYRGRDWEKTAEEIKAALARAERVVGRPAEVGDREIMRHLRQSLARPLEAWRDLTEDELARFSEHGREFPGFSCSAGEVRVYPEKTLASQLIGYVGRDRVASSSDEKFSFREFEMRGRGGLEYYSDGFLRGAPGEMRLQVDSRGFTHREWTVVEAKRGPDLRLTIDPAVQRAAEAQLADVRGACVVLDPRDGAVLAFASSNTIDLNRMVPVLSQACYEESLKSRNLASGGAYAPGSTFKPLTALAAMKSGVEPGYGYECVGYYECGPMKIRCARAWGHGDMDIRSALRESCNSFFCNLGVTAGTNAVMSTARAFGLGSRTGIDFVEDLPGLVPDAEAKFARGAGPWYAGDLAQMSIGQGLLLVTPLQMARVIGAINTGFLVTPRLNSELPPVRTPVRGFTEAQFRTVREGLAMVTNGGTGRRGAAGVDAEVVGKTGTAEVGYGERRYKNTWFVAYAKPNAKSRSGSGDRTVAVAMVIEHGESGGGTTAPRVAEILKTIYNRHD